MISQQIFFHGWFYAFRIHEDKKRGLCSSHTGLFDFLDFALTRCPNEYFSTGPRGSKLRFSIPIPLVPVIGHEVSHLAGAGLACSHEKTPHAKVQNFMLEHDDKTIAMEVPLWFTPIEMEPYASLFGSSSPLTGHIDILRIEDNHIWIWDFKPNAHKEKHAHIQLFFYALMLSARTGIPVSSFRCGYFDDAVAYLFQPDTKFVKTGADHWS